MCPFDATYAYMVPPAQTGARGRALVATFFVGADRQPRRRQEELVLSRPLRIVMAGCGVLCLRRAPTRRPPPPRTCRSSREVLRRPGASRGRAGRADGCPCRAARPPGTGWSASHADVRSRHRVCVQPAHFGTGQRGYEVPLPRASKASRPPTSAPCGLSMPSTAETRKSTARAVRSLVGTGFEACWAPPRNSSGVLSGS